MSPRSRNGMQTLQGLARVTVKEPQVVEKSQNDLLGEVGTGIDGEGSHLRLDFS